MKLSIFAIIESLALLALPSCLGVAALLFSSGCWYDQFGDSKWVITYGTTLTFEQTTKVIQKDQRAGFRAGFAPDRAVQSLFALLESENEPPVADGVVMESVDDDSDADKEGT